VKMDCPVCKKSGLPSSATVCPQCDTNFSHLIELRSLRHQFSSIKYKTIVLIVIIVLLLSYSVTTIFIWQFHDASSQNGANEGGFTDSLNNFKKQNSNLISIIDSLQRPTSLNTIYYNVKHGDNIYDILKIFSLNRRYIDEIVKLNNLQNPNYIFEGQVLKIPIINN